MTEAAQIPEAILAASYRAYEDWGFLLETGNTIEFIAKVISDHQPKPTPKLGGLTRQQRRAMDFIFAYVKQHNFAPSYQEIMEAIDLKSKSGVHRIVYALAERGAVEIVMGKRRARNLIVNHQYQVDA